MARVLRSRSRPDRRLEWRLGLGALLASLLLTSGSSAQNLVYHSPGDDGVNPGAPLQLPISSNEPLFLYLDVGSFATTSGIACNDGDGREVCGYAVVIDAVGGALFVDFVPEPNVIHRLIPTQLRANGTFSLNPALGPVRLGELKVASSQPGGEVMVMGGEAVLAALQVESVAQSILATTPAPEPGTGALLIGGTLTLCALGRRRALRRAPEAR